MKCERCGREINDPVEHEFCDYPRTANYDFKALENFKAPKPVKPKPYVAPTVQAPIGHQVIMRKKP